MPTVQVNLTTNSQTVTTPYSIPFELPHPKTNHTYHPIYFKSIGASFISDQNLPSTMSIRLDNIHNDVKHAELVFPTYRAASLTPTPTAYHFTSDMHLGAASSDHIIRGKITFRNPVSIQLPHSISLVFLIDSEYM